ncbi:MAG: hypothetical protein B7Z37_24950 [Verrucomicrobia bacterium 12-59-8]|nr:MAG: hypothetical protein B7Z37_24950 [Verrucomicrobia bacterium 12-59-8]
MGDAEIAEGAEIVGGAEIAEGAVIVGGARLAGGAANEGTTGAGETPGAVSGGSCLGNVGAPGPSDGRVSKGESGPILMVSCACVPAGATDPRARMTVRMALHREDDRKCFCMQ